MKRLLYICITLAFFACKEEKKTATPESVQEETTATTEETTSEAEESAEKLPILTGVQSRKAIASAPYDSWFGTTYAVYAADKETLDAVKPLTNGVKVKIFMGTWCEDSQREVPHFYKIVDVLKLDDANIELITVDEEKETPKHLEDGFNITNVPTFIFMKDGKEMNRIVEFPVTSLEKDMLQILSGEAYKHSYAE
ncbi:thioredoxin family protein [uncultured Kordia sp.]|uniref:thioredoxin family protein n=1 Tax=uncultured Kordia sp. TaxID=507699 RepID=UPI00262072A5|nr:thioredoxin family protein [uncultured Kordia sp.]